ncbi:MAG: primosomal protein N' [Gammaproteobacteria bacterium]|nr:primosomal protein N' [Gammaproteobacteria bacterium]
MIPLILRIAVPSPLRRLFDYLPPHNAANPIPGQRYLIPFGRGQSVGILVAVSDHSELPREKLKAVLKQLDQAPLLDAPMMKLLRWACDYYHHPPGEVFQAALPVLLRQERSAAEKGVAHWRLSEAGAALDPATLARAPRQQALLKLLQGVTPSGLTASAIDQHQEKWLPLMRILVEKGWVVREERAASALERGSASDCRPPLTDAQQQAVSAINSDRGFQVSLLDGVTGSGKTEVYLQAIAAVLAQGRQALVLIPEIGLSPQLVSRFARRFAVPIALLHSGLSDGERLSAWQLAAKGEAEIIIGTRSAIFTPMKQPGLIIVDEEHDGSFKQQDGFRYSARDVAVVRARQLNIPIVLGSATPSLESLHNALAGRYRHLLLPERAGNAIHPTMRLLDVRQQPMEEGVSLHLQQAIRHHLEHHGQVLLFLNRRGYAPVMMCHDCGWVSQCPRCDAHMTVYAGQQRLRCHHCASERPLPPQCPDCGSSDLRPIGQGTERIEQHLQALFPGREVLRIDRDTTRRKGSMDKLLEQIHGESGQLLIGTQMLAKGHHFPNVTLVGILDADQGLFSVDFRAAERMAQLIIQVAGRAGRAERPGEVLIQTHVPDHPLLKLLVEKDYAHFALATLQERRAAELPPFFHFALLRAEALERQAPLAFLEAARHCAEQLGHDGVWLLGPIPAPMERRAGRSRAQLLLQAEQRADLHRLLNSWAVALEGIKEGRKVRWSLDVDPVELY